MGKLEGRGPLGRPRQRWEDNIKMEVGWGIDWIDVAQDSDRWRALVNQVMNLHFAENALNFWTSWEPVRSLY